MGATTKGRWSYACSKAIDEFLALAYYKEKRLPVVVVRLFNTVGPRQTGRYGMVDPELREAGAAGAAASPSTATASRAAASPTSSDVVGALLQARSTTRGAVGEVFNIGNARGGLDPRARRAGEGAHRLASPRSSMMPYDRPTRRASRTCRAACPTPRRSGPSSDSAPATSLDGILREVIKHMRPRRTTFPDAVSSSRPFLCALALTPVVRALARRNGMVAAPKSDRWHSQPTAMLGGVAIFAASWPLLVMLPARGRAGSSWPPARALFLVGLVDDFLHLKPYQKLVGQLLAASAVVYFGLVLPWTGSFVLNMLITHLLAGRRSPTR